MKVSTPACRRSWLSLGLAVVMGASLAMPAYGQFLTLEFYRSLGERGKTSPAMAQSKKVLLEGLIDGIETMAAANRAAGIKPEFCPPKDFRMSPDELAKTIDAALMGKAKFFTDSDGIGAIAMFVLQERFPCND